MNEININGVTYVPKDEQPELDAQYVIVRGDRSGVFAGYLIKTDGKTVVLDRCRNLWYWSGANAISEIAKYGVTQPDKCKFTVETNGHVILDVIEIIPVSLDAMKIIVAVPEWKKKGE